MAIYHFTTQSISGGRSAVAAAAYRAGDRLEDRNTGEEHDYRRRGGIVREDGEVLLPEGSPDWAKERQGLWNGAQDGERNKDGTMRKNARVAREWEVSLPHELNREQRKELGREFAQEVVNRYGVAVQLDFHAPGTKGDNRNWHIHVQATSRELGSEGFGQKAKYDRADRDLKAEGLPNGKAQLNDLRKTWGDMANRALERAGHEERIDHRSLADQREAAREIGDQDKASDLDREPTRHMGPAATALERGKPLYRNGEELPDRWKREPQKTELGDTNRRIELAAELGKIQREKESVGRSIIDTESSIGEAIKERNGQFRDFLNGQRENAGSRGIERKPEREQATDQSITDALKGYADYSRQPARQESLSERFGHLVKPQDMAKSEQPTERESEAPRIITEPSAGAREARMTLAERFGHLIKPQHQEAEKRLILPESFRADADRQAAQAFSNQPQKEQAMFVPTSNPSEQEEQQKQEQALNAPSAGEQVLQQQPQEQEAPQPNQQPEQEQPEQKSKLQELGERIQQQQREREEQQRENRSRGPEMSM